ncbi:hypothetical protein WHI96_19220 [Pseudonocardia tropica]|uniref:Putative antitoxin VapB45-like DNA-binding HTH domain-containing protein n=1 Tax=Pseudonocardia tropica TaxID=681289 RepID=A0ABV1JZC8_9PSEU
MDEAGIELLHRPVYGMSQAARLLNLRADGLRRWIDGYSRAGKTYAPVIRETSTGNDSITWGEFIEAGYLREYRAKQVPLQYLRPVIGLLRERFDVQYPLATLKPYTSGKDLAMEVQQFVGLDPDLSIVVLGRDGTLKLADQASAFVDKVEFTDEAGIAGRLFPYGKQVPIVLDPERSFGEPTVPDGVRTDILAELVEAGEDPRRVAELYELPVTDVEQAVRFEQGAMKVSAEAA